MSTPWFARRRRATQHLWRGRRRPAPRRVVASAQQPRRARRGRPQPPPRGISTRLPPPSWAGPGTDSLLHLRRGTQHDRWRCAMRRAHPDLPCSGRRHVMARRRVCDAREACRRRVEAAGTTGWEPSARASATSSADCRSTTRLTGVRCGHRIVAATTTCRSVDSVGVRGVVRDCPAPTCRGSPRRSDHAAQQTVAVDEFVLETSPRAR